MNGTVVIGEKKAIRRMVRSAVETARETGKITTASTAFLVECVEEFGLSPADLDSLLEVQVSFEGNIKKAVELMRDHDLDVAQVVGLFRVRYELKEEEGLTVLFKWLIFLSEAFAEIDFDSEAATQMIMEIRSAVLRVYDVEEMSTDKVLEAICEAAELHRCHTIEGAIEMLERLAGEDKDEEEW